MRKALVSLVLVCTAVAAAAAPANIASLIGVLPEGSSVVVAVDVAALRAQPTIQSWLLEHSAPWSGVDEETASFLAEAGLDPVRDVDLMVVAMRDGNEDDPLALFAGRYDPSSLGAALVKHGAEVVQISGRTAYKLEGLADSTPDAPFMTVADDLVMVGSRDAIAAAAAGGANGSAIVADSVRLGHLDLNAPFWMVVDVPEQVEADSRQVEIHSDDPDMQTVDGLLHATASVRRVAMYARVSDLLEISSTAMATTEENAELLRDAVKGVIAAARLQAQETHPEVVDILRKVKVVTDGNTLTVAGAVPVTLLEELAMRDRHHEVQSDR